jgi:hypothetical protein
MKRKIQKQGHTSSQCFGSGSEFDLSPGSGSAFCLRIRIQLLMKLASKAKIIHTI